MSKLSNNTILILILILLVMLTSWASIAYGLAENSMSMDVTCSDCIDNYYNENCSQDSCLDSVCSASNSSSTGFMNNKYIQKIKSVSETIADGYPPEYNPIISGLFIRPPIT